MMSALFILILLNFIFYLPSLNFFFISDDFYFLSFKNLQDVIFLKPDFYHYNPVFWLIIWITKIIFGLNPFYFHLTTLLVHILNVLVIYYLGNLLFRDRKIAFIVSLIFSFFFSHYEVVYWITGLNTSLMVFFYTLGLITFIRLIGKITFLRYSIFLLFLTLAILSHEYAVSLPIVCFFYWLLFKKEKKKLLDILKIFLLPGFVIFLTLLIKLTQSKVYLIVKIPSFARFFISILKSFLYLFIPNPYFIDSLSKILLIVLGVVLIGFLILKSFREKYNLFLLLWFSITIIIFSATSLPQARYFYLSSIPAIYLTISLLKKAFLEKISPLRILSIIYIVFIFLSGIIFLKEQERLWSKTSLITKNILYQLKPITTLSTPGVINVDKTIYFINLPDSINGPPWPAYLFRNGFDSVLKLYINDKIEEAKYFRTMQNDNILRNDPFISREKLQSLRSSGDLIFMYNNNSESLNQF